MAYAPTAPEFVIPLHLLRVILLERLQLPLLIAEATCIGCQAPLNPRGRHRAACPRTGRLKKRATPVERVLASICRASGLRERFSAFLRDMNIGVTASDNRQIEVLAQDLPCLGEAQLVVDVTLRGVLCCEGEPHHDTADTEGAVLIQARHDKEIRYLELFTSRRCRLVVVAVETGCRWSDEGVEFIRLPMYMWPAVLAWQRRWTRMLSTACSLFRGLSG